MLHLLLALKTNQLVLGEKVIATFFLPNRNVLLDIALLL